MELQGQLQPFIGEKDKIAFGFEYPLHAAIARGAVGTGDAAGHVDPFVGVFLRQTDDADR